MKVCVLGAGVIGVSTAFALGRSGHEVHVIDRAADVASGTSRSNGAQLSFSYVDPFAGPAALRQLPAYLLGLDPAVRLGASFKPSYLSWGLGFLRNCTAKRAALNTEALASLAKQSEAAMALFMEDCPKESLKPTGQGKIILASNAAQLANMRSSVKAKAEMGIALEVLSTEDCKDKEPALETWHGALAGGLYAAGDMALDTLMYCRALKSVCESRFGTSFHMNESVMSVSANGEAVEGVQTDQGFHACEAVISCLGGQTNALVKSLGLSVPIYPMQGYSVTLPAQSGAPRVSITDAQNKIVFANLGDRVRIAGFMDANQSPHRADKRGRELLETARTLWPSIAKYNEEPHYWTGFRPMTPSGVPVIEETKLRGLYLNTGHGALGYTFAAGSGVRIAELIGRPEWAIKDSLSN